MRRHEGALADMPPDRALALQRIQRLAQGGAAHPEAADQFPLGRQPVAGRVGARRR